MTAGSGEITLESVELRDETGAAAAVFTVGKKMVLRLRFRAHAAVENPRLWVEFYNEEEGAYVCGLLEHYLSSDTHQFVKLHLDTDPGTYAIEYAFEPLLMGSGSYYMTVTFPRMARRGSVADLLYSTAYSHYRRVACFKITTPIGCFDVRRMAVEHPVRVRLWNEANPALLPAGEEESRAEPSACPAAVDHFGMSPAMICGQESVPGMLPG